jgi:hypothetical protein
VIIVWAHPHNFSSNTNGSVHSAMVQTSKPIINSTPTPSIFIEETLFYARIEIKVFINVIKRIETKMGSIKMIEDKVSKS